MKKIGLALIAAILLTGCTSQIKLTTQESNEISEYAAYAVLKYDNNYQETLVSSAKIKVENTEESSNESNEKSLPEEEENQTDASQISEPVLLENEEEGSATLSGVLGFEDVSADYTGFEIVDSYPQETQKEEEPSYIEKATEDHSLLVLQFTLTNQTENTKVCDVLSTSPKFNVVLNDTEQYSALTTLVLNDLSTCYQELVSGESVEMVLIFEIPVATTEKEMEGITLNVDLNENTSNIVLK